MTTTKRMDHTAYPESLKEKSWAELRLIIEDAKAALAAHPETENASYYADEICYASNEIYLRKNALFKE